MTRSVYLVSAFLGAWALALGGCGGKAITGQECGNGLIEGNEVCEATDLAGQDCTDHGFLGGILACDTDCRSFDLTLCGNYVCNNGIVEPGESCEATDLDGATCSSLGFDGGTLSCTTTCAFDTSQCIQPGCGDGTVSGNEVCDGANLNGEDCVSQGFNAGTLACEATCGAFDTSGCADWQCGDGTVSGPEVCDGSDVGTMTCTDFGFTGGTLGCTSDCLDYDRGDCAGAGCGNGILEPGEVCDLTELGGLDCLNFGFDGGTLACSQQCDSFDDSGCFDAVCGDNVANGAEACDGADLGGADCTSLALGFVGGTLACDGSCTFDTGGCTAAPPAGDDCANAGVLPATGLPYSVTGDTSTGADDYAATGGSCVGMPNAEGGNSADVVYEFTPASDALYRLTYYPEWYDGSIYIVTDCADIDNTCVGGSEGGDGGDTEILDASLVTGTTYYVILDGGWNGQDGNYTLSVCQPDCTGKACGDDGCGASCGSCTGGDVCDPASFACVDPSTLPGNDCSAPIVVTGVPYTDQGSTVGHSDDYTGSPACPGLGQPEGGTSPDVAYEFTPALTGIYHIDYEPTFDGAVYVATDCGDIPGTCIGGSEAASYDAPWNEIIDASMIAGTTYYIIVDGGTNAGPSGDYTLSIDACTPDCTGKTCGTDGCGGSCGTCTGGDVCDDIQGQCADPTQVAGEDCANPVVVDTANLPFVYVEDTTGSTDAASHGNNVCPGEGGGHGSGAGDHAYELTPSVAGTYEIRLNPYGWDGMFYVVTDCTDVNGSCVYSEDDAAYNLVESMYLTLDAGTTYYIIVDGAENSGAEGAYQLFVGPPIPASDCTNPITIPGVPFTDSGDTSLGGNSYTAADTCPGIGQIEGESSPDVVYEFSPATTGDYTITYTPTFDGALYVVTDCADIPNSCLAASEDANPWDPPPLEEVITLTMTAGTTYYIILDGGQPAGSYGSYTLEIQ